MPRRWSILVFLLLGALHGMRAQEVALRFILPEFPGIHRGEPFRGTHLGLGVDRVFADGGALVGVDVVWGVGGMMRERSIMVPVALDGYKTTYYVAPRDLTVLYRAVHLFGEQDAPSFYAGSYVGLRWVRDRMFLGSVSQPSGTPLGISPFADELRMDRMLVPLGLRVGHRGVLHIIHTDLYLMFGPQLGSGNSDLPADYLPADHFRMAPWSFTFGGAFGFRYY